MLTSENLNFDVGFFQIIRQRYIFYFILRKYKWVDRLLEKENDGKNVIYFWIIISFSFSDNVYTFDYWLIWFETKQEEEENIDSKSET